MSQLVQGPPLISSVNPAKVYDGADILATMEDPETGEVRTMMRWQWQERYDEFEAKKAAAYEASKPKAISPIEEMAERVKQQYADIDAMPTEQALVKGATACKCIWGENMLLCTVVNPHATRAENSNLIIPYGDETAEKAYLQFWEKSTIVKVVRVSKNVDTKKYPELKEARIRLALGMPGPIIELKPGAGSPRRGEHGEACIIVHAMHVWLGFPYQTKLTWKHRIQYFGMRCLSALMPWSQKLQGVE